MTMALLAQAAAKPQSLGPFLATLGVLIVVIGAASIALVWYRRKVLGRDSAEQQSAMLDGLRGMRSRGEITDEEYDAARKSMVARFAGAPVPNAAQIRPPAPGARKPPAAERGTPPPSGPSLGGDEGRTALPGFDLTGAPLPRPREDR